MVDVVWLKDNQPIDTEDFTMSTTTITGSYVCELEQAVSSTIQRINSKIQLTCKDVVYYDGDYKCNFTNTGPDENKRGKLTEVISLRTKC